MRKFFNTVDFINILAKTSTTAHRWYRGPHVSAYNSPGYRQVVDNAILELTASLAVSNRNCFNNSSIM